jgi:ABC-type sugar transport system substrate-binding protein
MRREKLVLFSFLGICIFLLAACSKTPAAQTAATNTLAAPTLAATFTVIPTEIPTPTATAIPPLPCTIAFDTDRDANREIYVMGPDGSNPTNLTNNPGDDTDPAWSPDGSQIAFVSSRVNDKEGGQFIYVMNADGSNVRQLTQENESKYPDWSHDGSQITYTNKGDIYVIKADGSGQSVNMTNSPEEDMQSTWSPDGSKIAWLSGKNEKWNIMVMNTDGSNVKKLTDNGEAYDITWTVDNQIFSHWNHPDGICTKCVMDADGSNAKDAGGKGDLQAYMPFWTVDGDRVECVSVNINGTDDEIYLVGTIYPDMFLNLTNNPANDQNPDWPANCGTGSTAAKITEEATQKVPGKSNAEIIIGYTGDRNSQEETDLQKACSELAVQCKEGKDITELTNENVNAIVYFSNRWNVMGDSMKVHDAAVKRVPVIVLNAESEENYEPGVYNLSIDSDSMTKTLDWIFEGMGGSGKFLYFNVGNSSFHQKVIDQALKKNQGITAISIPAEYDGKALQNEKIVSLINENPGLGGLWADEYIPNLFWAVTSLQSDKLPRIPCEAKEDILKAWKVRLDAGSSFQCMATIQPGGTGYEGVYVAYYLATGEQINPQALGGVYGNTLIYDYPVITNANLNDWLAKLDDFRAGDRGVLQMAPMTPEEIKAKWFVY